MGSKEPLYDCTPLADRDCFSIRPVVFRYVRRCCLKCPNRAVKQTDKEKKDNCGLSLLFRAMEQSADPCTWPTVGPYRISQPMEKACTELHLHGGCQIRGQRQISSAQPVI